MVEKINRIIRFFVKSSLKLLAVFFLAAVLIFPAHAQSAPSLISDDETEDFLRQIIRPIFNAAGVSFNPHKIFIINDLSLNAFVSDGNYMFIHTGTLLNADNSNQLSGVLAHETGHIASGHIVRQKLRINQLQALSAASLIAAGAAAVTSGRGDAAMAIILGSQSSLINSLNAYQVHEERSADESAIRYLKKLGLSPLGLYEFIKKIQNSNRLNGVPEITYFSTHPLTRERLKFFEESIKNSTGITASVHDEQLKMIKAKLSAFLLPTDRVKKLYPFSKKTPDALYAHAILYYRENKVNDAIKILDALILSSPQNPYYHELKGQFLFESGQPDKALDAFEQARNLSPNAPDALLGWAQAALETSRRKVSLNNIISALNQSLNYRPNLTAWLLLARAYAENDQQAEALYASAYYSAAVKNFPTALRQIEQAEKLNPVPSLKLKLSDLKKSLSEN